MLTPAKELTKNFSLDQFLEAKTAFAIAQAKYREESNAIVQFISPTYENMAIWRRKLTDMGYKIKNLESSIIGIETYQVSW